MLLASEPPPRELEHMLVDLRVVYESALTHSLGKVQTEGSCMYAAILVQAAVTQWLPGFTAAIRGGDGCGDGGYFDSNGNGRGHYWVEVDDGQRCWIADITADQFGADTVVLQPLLAVVRIYVAGNPERIAEHVSDTLELIRSDSKLSPL